MNALPENGVASRIAWKPAVCDDDRMAFRVLIVDDHPGFRARARALLESEGFEVVGEAGTGADAVRIVHDLRPDVVLLDVQLPDTDGFAVSSAVTADGSDAQVVLTSSRDGSDFGALIGSCGARGFIAKAELSGARVAALLR
jgi:DNA-binding NarL/FixJ family response regulator